MELIIVLVFILGYFLIAFEHPLKLDKAVPALFMAVAMWAILAVGFNHGWFSIVDSHDQIFNFVSGGKAAEEGFKNVLLHHLGNTAEILIFLIGAMTIIELIDLHQGFEILKGFVKTQNKTKLLWIIGTLAFFLSSLIDNMTTTIVLVTLLRKLLDDKELRMWYAGMVIIAANAGGTWSPIGDITTTMLWIANKVSVFGLIENIIIPSLACFAVPFLAASFMPVFRGKIFVENKQDLETEELGSSRTMLILGLGAIVFVPVFKILTGLPPYMGMMLGLSAVWLVSEYIHPEEEFPEERKNMYSAHRALSRIEIASVLFFLGILMAVAAMETLVYGVINGKEFGTLRYLAEVIQNVIPNQDIVVVILGLFSAVIDNVPLVAASIGMYVAPTDSPLWHFIAYSAGTGGSILIIGSAAGVAAMGMEKINFIWYLKNISWLAALGFFAGAGTFLFIEHFIRR